MIKPDSSETLYLPGAAGYKTIYLLFFSKKVIFFVISTDIKI
jgi:hypothetical protein